jgi:hypothetical protein
MPVFFNDLIPELIVKGETDHPDAGQCSLFPDIRRSVSVNRLVTL